MARLGVSLVWFGLFWFISWFKKWREKYRRGKDSGGKDLEGKRPSGQKT